MRPTNSFAYSEIAQSNHAASEIDPNLGHRYESERIMKQMKEIPASIIEKSFEESCDALEALS